MAEYDDILTLEAHLKIMLEKVEAIRKKMTAPEKKPRKPSKKELMTQYINNYWAKRDAQLAKKLNKQ